MFDKEIIKKGCKYGFPPAIQSGVAACGNIALKNFMNGFGTQTAAAITTRLQSGFDNTYAHNKFKLGNFNNNGTKQGRKKRPSHEAVFQMRNFAYAYNFGTFKRGNVFLRWKYCKYFRYGRKRGVRRRYVL